MQWTWAHPGSSRKHSAPRHTPPSCSQPAAFSSKPGPGSQGSCPIGWSQGQVQRSGVPGLPGRVGVEQRGQARAACSHSISRDHQGTLTVPPRDFWKCAGQGLPKGSFCPSTGHLLCPRAEAMHRAGGTHRAGQRMQYVHCNLGSKVGSSTPDPGSPGLPSCWVPHKSRP